MKLSFFIVLLSFYSFSQTNRTFKIVDQSDNSPVAFANIIFNDDVYSGTISDIDGLFKIPSDVKKITISYIGYESQTLNIDDLKTNVIRLEQKISALDEVVINSTENPAHRIIRNAVKNKDINNPEHLDAFTYTSYDKIYIDTEGIEIKEDTLNEIGEFFDKSYLFITETVAKHKHLRPGFSEDSIIATRSSGFKSPEFAVLANALQPFSFYEDYINLFDTDYLNPISKGSTKKYKFRIEDEYLRGKDTIFAISFEPNANRNFEGLKGLVYINSNTYAVQSVDATTYNSGRIKVAIQQKYNYLEETQWFPEQLNFQIDIGADSGVLKENFGMFKYVGKSYLSDINLNPSLHKKDFSVLPLGVQKKATQKDFLFWKSARRDTLSIKETQTYKIIDSIGEKLNFDKLATLTSDLSKGRIPLKYIDVDISKSLIINKHENLRLGLGLYTNDDLFEHVSFGGFAGYGFKDSEWKYGGSVEFDVPSKKDISFSFSYENNLKEVGRPFSDRSLSFFNFRNLIAERMDQIESFDFKTEMKLFRNIDWSIGVTRAKITPLYNYQYNNGSGAVTQYNTTELHIGLRYFVNEKLTNMFNSVFRLDSDDPVFNLNYTRGFSNLFGSDFSYNKIQFTMDDSFRIKGLGKMSYRIDAGYIDSSVPYGQSFTGEGSFDKGFPYVFNNYFQTVKPYEFLSDRYVHLFTEHNFGTLFNNKGYFTPEIVLHNNLGIGDLMNPEHHQNISFSTKRKLFLETGLELRNLVKFPMMNMGYFSLGVGGFYRYGYHRLPNSSDNFVFKLSTGFTFK